MTRLPVRLVLLGFLSLTLLDAAIGGGHGVGRWRGAAGAGDDGSDIAAAQSASFGDLDADGKGGVSASERALGLRQLDEALRETRSSLHAAIDRDRDGTLAKSECRFAGPRIRSLVKQAQALAEAAYDVDGDHACRAPKAVNCSPPSRSSSPGPRRGSMATPTAGSRTTRPGRRSGRSSRRRANCSLPAMRTTTGI